MTEQGVRGGPVSGERLPRVLAATFLVAAGITLAALPVFRDYVVRAHSHMAAALLDDAYQRWQKHRDDASFNRLLSLELLGYPGSTVYLSWDGSVHDRDAGGSIYRLSLRLPADASQQESCGLIGKESASGFVLVAQALNRPASGLCASLCRNSAGLRRVTGRAEASDCWGTSTALQ